MASHDPGLTAVKKVRNKSLLRRRRDLFLETGKLFRKYQKQPSNKLWQAKAKAITAAAAVAVATTLALALAFNLHLKYQQSPSTFCCD